ncbi:hypothetical protein DMENIID0001_069340 [Sergentomyia squamirostris]
MKFKDRTKLSHESLLQAPQLTTPVVVVHFKTGHQHPISIELDDLEAAEQFGFGYDRSYGGYDNGGWGGDYGYGGGYNDYGGGYGGGYGDYGGYGGYSGENWG